MKAREQGMRTLHCYASCRDGDWEAICLDLDIAVQGQSFDDVQRSLHEAVALYLETVATLTEDQQSHLLHRPARRQAEAQVVRSGPSISDVAGKNTLPGQSVHHHSAIW